MTKHFVAKMKCADTLNPESAEVKMIKQITFRAKKIYSSMLYKGHHTIRR